MTEPSAVPAKTKRQAIDKMSFEEAMQELESIVSSMESGETALEESIAAFERGMELQKHCQAKLTEAQAKIEKILVDSDGKAAGSEPLDPENPNQDQ